MTHGTRGTRGHPIARSALGLLGLLGLLVAGVAGPAGLLPRRPLLAMTVSDVTPEAAAPELQEAKTRKSVMYGDSDGGFFYDFLGFFGSFLSVRNFPGKCDAHVHRFFGDVDLMVSFDLNPH